IKLFRMRNTYQPSIISTLAKWVPVMMLMVCAIVLPQKKEFTTEQQERRHAMKLETLAIHAGYSPDPTTKAVAVPIYQTTSYAFDNTQHGADLFDLKVQGNIYSRIMNPTNDVLEKRVAALAGGVGALAMTSGMAPITASIQSICEAGDNIISDSQLYGGTYNQYAHTFPRQEIEV